MGRAEDRSEHFVALLKPLQRSLEFYCRRMLRNPAHVEDVLQAAIMAAFSRFDRYAEGTNFRAWIFRFVTLELFNQNRKREVALFAEIPQEASSEPREELPEDMVQALLVNPGELMEHFEDQVADALWQLTGLERAVLLLRALGEFSYQQIHEVLSIPLGSVMGYLSRARQKLRRALVEFANQRGLFRHTEGLR